MTIKGPVWDLFIVTKRKLDGTPLLLCRGFLALQAGRPLGKLGVEKLFREVFIRVNTIEIEKQASLEEEEWQLKDEED